MLSGGLLSDPERISKRIHNIHGKCLFFKNSKFLVNFFWSHQLPVSGWKPLFPARPSAQLVHDLIPSKPKSWVMSPLLHQFQIVHSFPILLSILSLPHHHKEQTRWGACSPTQRANHHLTPPDQKLRLIRMLRRCWDFSVWMGCERNIGLRRYSVTYRIKRRPKDLASKSGDQYRVFSNNILFEVLKKGSTQFYNVSGFTIGLQLDGSMYQR